MNGGCFQFVKILRWHRGFWYKCRNLVRFCAIKTCLPQKVNFELFIARSVAPKWNYSATQLGERVGERARYFVVRVQLLSHSWQNERYMNVCEKYVHACLALHLHWLPHSAKHSKIAICFLIELRGRNGERDREIAHTLTHIALSSASNLIPNERISNFRNIARCLRCVLNASPALASSLRWQLNAKLWANNFLINLHQAARALLLI